MENPAGSKARRRHALLARPVFDGQPPGRRMRGMIPAREPVKGEREQNSGYRPSPVFPRLRLRRLRRSEGLRALVRETALDPGDLVMPFFVRAGAEEARPIASMPGHFQHSRASLLKTASEAPSLGIRAVILFGIPEDKDASAVGAWKEDGIVQETIRALKDAHPDLVVMADLCLCEYMDHGHCGVVREGEIVNDETIALYGKTAVSLARAGADVIAPSGMMDGQVAAIREGLDSAGFSSTPILAYAAKHASALYGPFREAAESAPAFADRAGYQMDPANRREAMREIEQDIIEGADAVMVKPALSALDIIRDASRLWDLPVAAYSVSGEYAMVKAASQKGWIDEKKAALECLTAVKRAGARFIVSYYAFEAARWLGR